MMLASSNSVWNWISSTTFSAAKVSSSSSNSISEQKKVPTPPVPPTASKNKQLHQRSNVAASTSSPATTVSATPPDWRSQMEAIVKLSVELEQRKSEGGDESSTSTTPKWCKAVVQALRLQKLQHQKQQGEEGEEREVFEARSNMITRFWEVAADEGNIIAGVEFARCVLGPLLPNDQQQDVPSSAAEIDDAAEEQEAARIQKALRFLDRGCTSQIPSAMHLVAKILSKNEDNNKIVDLRRDVNLPAPNPAAARAWLERAASLDYAPALDEIGHWMFFQHSESSESTNSTSSSSLYPYNVVGAMRCFKKAADLGFVESNFHLGKLFLHSLLDEDTPQQQKEKISRAQYFLNQFLTLDSNSDCCVEAVELLEKCGKKLGSL